ncbi:MAG TPA: DUF3052 domain-containing protein [Acidimicrobiales bacterium]|nr:DUF3052 domain-containing protein [Acidimicrobiales bacterium]
MTLGAGYSGTPLPQKLGIKEGHRVLLMGGAVPAGFLDDIDVPGATVVRRAAKQPANVVVLFVLSVAELRERLPAAQAAITVDGGVWVAWPKKASGVPTDMTEDVIRQVMPASMVDNKVCAIDEVWSGLRLVVRLDHR